MVLRRVTFIRLIELVHYSSYFLGCCCLEMFNTLVAKELFNLNAAKQYPYRQSCKYDDCQHLELTFRASVKNLKKFGLQLHLQMINSLLVVKTYISFCEFLTLHADSHIKQEISSGLEEHYACSVEQDYESICWGCGLRHILPSNAPVFKCVWCGAITKQNECRRERKNLRWRRLRDRCFVVVLLIFMVFIICGGVWAVYPVVFSVSYVCGVFHCIVTFILAVTTVSMFSLAAFSDAGTPQSIVWGSYPTVRKDDLLDYTFCEYCSKPKSPRTHHCSSCGMCVLDMDHHCPFIGNCVGAANHRYFICFLIAAVHSVAYAAAMSAYSALHILPPLNESAAAQMHKVRDSIALADLLKEIFTFWVTSALFFSARGLVLLYLFVASISVEIGLTVLLWQQLYFIYEGRTYLTSLTSEGEAERDYRNLYRFFGFPYLSARYLPSWCNSRKIHRK